MFDEEAIAKLLTLAKELQEAKAQPETTYNDWDIGWEQGYAGGQQFAGIALEKLITAISNEEDQWQK